MSEKREGLKRKEEKIPLVILRKKVRRIVKI